MKPDLFSLVEDYGALEEYAGDKQGYYQVLSNDRIVESVSHRQTGRVLCFYW
jgi:hypothetical protein